MTTAFLSSLLVQGPPTRTSPRKRQRTTDPSGKEEEDENQLDYSWDEETEDIAEDKSDDNYSKKKSFGMEKVCNHDIYIYIYIYISYIYLYIIYIY